MAYLGQAPETASGGGFFENVLDPLGRFIAQAGPAAARIIEATRGGPKYAGSTERYGYPDNAQPRQRPRSSPTPNWMMPAVIGLGGVALFAMLSPKRKR